MIGALFFLIWNSWKNRTRMRIRRLKQPKYLVGAIFGVLYFFYVFGFRLLLMSGGHKGKYMDFITPENSEIFESAGALILFALILMAWVVPQERAALVFSEAEITFLFPAPVTRKMLIHYKLAKSQVTILFMILFMTIILGRFWAGGIAWIRAIGWWVIFSTLNLHLLGASFARTSLTEHGISNWKRRAIILTLVGAVAIGIFFWAKQTIPAPDFDNLKNRTDAEYYFDNVVSSGPLPYLLYPFRIVVRPFVAGAAGNFLLFLQALGPAALLMALHYFWVMRANVAFEEASIEVSRKVAERVASIRANRGQWVSKPKKKKRAPFKLNPLGMPSIGFLWKNLIAAGQSFTWQFWLLMVCVSLPAGTSLAFNPSTANVAMTVGMIATMFLGMSFLLGPQMLRHDFRQDLPMADVLKTYPLRGWQMAFGQLLAPAVILTGLQWLLLILCVTVLPKFGRTEIPLMTRLMVALAVAVMAPPLNLVSLVIPNASVLLFPGWFQTGKNAAQGIEATGQRIIFLLGQLIVFAVAMIPAALIFGFIYFFGAYFIGPWLPVPFAAFGAAIALGAEAWVGMLWLGKIFEKFDVAVESAP